MHVSSLGLRLMMGSMTISGCGGWILLVTSCMKPFQFGRGSAGVLNNPATCHRQSISEDIRLVKNDMIFSYGLNMISKPQWDGRS